MAAHSDGAMARTHTAPVRPWHEVWPVGQRFGGAGIGGGGYTNGGGGEGEGGGGGGGEIATGATDAQTIHPLYTTEPSEDHERVAPANIRALAGPFVPE